MWGRGGRVIKRGHERRGDEEGKDREEKRRREEKGSYGETQRCQARMKTFLEISKTAQVLNLT